jgi:hypothetical protein
LRNIYRAGLSFGDDGYLVGFEVYGWTWDRFGGWRVVVGGGCDEGEVSCLKAIRQGDLRGLEALVDEED